MRNSNDDDTGGSFADAFSKPLPDWFIIETEKREAFLKEQQAARERSMKEFSEKYDITEEDKLRMRQEKVDKYETKQASKSWDKEIVGVESNIVENSTRKNWEKIWEMNKGDDKEDEMLKLPGFFEVFPELKFKWPNWARNKQGMRKKCAVDSDCPFPLACCQHPIVSMDKFCCSGWGARAMVPQYCPQEVISEQGGRGKELGDGPRGGRKQRGDFSII